MQTFKTAVVVIALLVVAYGAYEILLRPAEQMPDDLAWLEGEGAENLEPPTLDLGHVDSSMGAVTAPPADHMGSHEAHAGNDPSRFAPPQSDYPPPPSQYQSLQPPADASQGTREPPAPAGAIEPPYPAKRANIEIPVPGLAPESEPIPGMQDNPHFGNSRYSAPAPSQAPSQQIGAQAFNRAMSQARMLIEQKKYYQALETLSAFYKSPDLTPTEQKELVDLLDPLAGRTIYSREHLIMDPYKVGRNETLAEIAAKYQVPWQLLQAINGIENPDVVLPSSELKVMQGPFSAQVDLVAGELTLFLGPLYAGRFPVTAGQQADLRAGEHQVLDKQRDPNFYGLQNATIPGGDPQNPYGRFWLSLGGHGSIHGSPLQGNGQLGCISLSPNDARDVYNILSVGSVVRVLR